MKQLEALLNQWRTLEAQSVSLGSIRTDDAFQPRNERLAPFDHRGRLESASEAHVTDLASKLEGGGELDPVLLARINNELFLIDGHHRLKAYRRQRRNYVLGRIMDTDKTTALLASKAVNCDGVKLPMHAEQRREAAWQYLAMVTERGRRELPKGTSLRAIGRTFGTTADTMSRMGRKLLQVKAHEYTPDACDAGTGWPQWKHVRGNATRDWFADVPEDAREWHRTERLAVKLGKHLDREGLNRFLQALHLLEVEAIEAAAERLEAAETLDDGGDY